MENITLSEYVQSVEDCLQHWLDVHTKAEFWAEEWITDDVEYSFKNSPVLSNNYFTFDWKESALRVEAKNTRHYYHICKNCGCMNDGYDCCESVKIGRNPTIKELADWLSEFDPTLSENVLLESLKEDGFKTYRKALKAITAPVEKEVKAVLNSIRKAKSNEDKLQAVLWGTRVYHVHGNIMSDYGCEDYKMIDNIRNNGLNSVFSKEEIEEFLNS